MTPKVGEVYMIDPGMAGKLRPAVIVSREDPNAPRALAVAVPLTHENRGSKYEVKMPRVPWLKLQSFANVQGINSVENHELMDKRGRFEPAIVRQIRDAIQWAPVEASANGFGVEIQKRRTLCSKSTVLNR